MRRQNLKNLAKADPERCFWVCDGQILSDLKELSAALRKMEKSVFKYHVNNEKNDFSQWVEEVLGDKKLAREIRKSKTLKGMATKIEKRI